MTHTIETRFARDPSAAAAALQEERLGCIRCQNSRADHQDAYCLPARNIGPRKYAMSALERYSHATNSSNLGMSDWKTLDVDWVAAAGACQVHGDPLPAQVARWLAGDHKQVFVVMATLQKRYGKTRMVSNDDRDDIMMAMAWWHDRTCPTCQGRCHPTAPDTPMLLEEDCETCRGTGLAPHDRATAAYSWGLRELDAAASICAYEVGAKVGLTRESV